MNRRVTKFGEKILKEKAEKVSVFDGELKALAADLIDTMYEEKESIRHRYAPKSEYGCSLCFHLGR